MVEGTKSSVWQSYRYPIMLLICIALGAVIGIMMGKDAEALKPFSDIFITMMFTIVVPLVFVNISSAVASIVDGKEWMKKKIFGQEKTASM